MKIKDINLSKKQKNIIILSLLISLGLGTIIVKNNIESQINQVGDLELLENETETYTLPGKEKIFLTGAINPTNQEDIYLEVDKGIIEKIYVLDGQYVSKGDTLVKYKDNNKAESVKEIEEQISELKKERKKEESITDEEGNIIGNISEIDKEIKQLNKEKNKLEQNIYSKVKAPFNGIIHINKDTNNENENNQSKLMTIQSLDYQIKGQVSEHDLLKIKEKDSAKILIFATKENRTGYVKHISTNPIGGIDDGSSEDLSYYEISIALDDQTNLINGFHAQATIEKEISSFKVPSTAIIKENNKTYVYKVVNGIAKKKEVKIEENNDNKDFITVVQGLTEETSIIRYPNEDTYDGMEIISNNYEEIEDIEIIE